MPYASLPSTTVTRLHRAGRLLLAASAIALATTACGGNDDDDAYPALQTIDSTKMQATVDELSDEMLVPGTVVLVRTPKGDFSTFRGTTTYKGTTPVSSQQQIRVGSVTKTWTGTVILQQVQEGLLQLSDPIGKYIAGVPKGDEITIEEMLLMRSGLFNYTTTVEFNQALDDDPLRVWAPSELLAMAFAHEQVFDPGTSYNYSNTNTVLLGLLAEQRENGKPLQDIVRDRIFKPLGLVHTYLPATSDNTLPEPLAHGYQYGSNVQTLGPLPADLQDAARAGTFLPTDETFANPSWGWSAGAGISTADDLVVFAQALVAGKLLNADLQAKRLASIQTTVPPTPGVGYGLALAKFGPLYGHTGELPGYNTFMAYDPVNKVTLVVWTNLGPTLDADAAATSIARKLIGQIYVKPF